MARNRSETSPSGDPLVDEAMRAWLRWHLCDGPTAEQERLSSLEIDAYDALSIKQRGLLHRMSGSGAGAIRDLIRHEPEFQNGAQQK